MKAQKWNSQPIGDLYSLITDGKHGDCANEENSGFYFISAKYIRDGRVCYENARQITESDFAETHRRTDLQPGDIMLTNSGTIGRLAVARDDDVTRRTTFQKSVAVLKPTKEKIDSGFLYYFLAASANTLDNAAPGAAHKNLLLSELRRLSVIVPPPAQQERIADVLSAYDELMEESARLLYREWFFRLRFPGHEHARLTHGIPHGWERVPLGERVMLNYGKSLKADERIDGTFPVYGSSGIVGSHEKPLTNGPGIILGRKGNVGSVFWSSKDFWPIDTAYFIDAETSNLYLFYALKNMHFINTDVAVPGLYRDMAYSRPLLVPSKSVLREFLECVSPIHGQLEKLNELNQKLRAARDLLLPRLMSGGIAV